MGSAPVDSELPHPVPGRVAHGFDQIARLERDRFERGADEMRAGRAAGESGPDAARVRLPVGRSQSREGGHERRAGGVRHRARDRLGLGRARDHAERVAEPLDRGARHEHAPFEGVPGLAARAARDRDEEAFRRGDPLPARVEEQEASGPVGVLHPPGFHASLAEERRLLIPRDPENRDAVPEARHAARLPEVRDRGTDLGQEGARDRERTEERWIPAMMSDVVEHRAARVRRVGGVGGAGGQLP